MESAFLSNSTLLLLPRRSYRVSSSRFTVLMALSKVWGSTFERMSKLGMALGLSGVLLLRTGPKIVGTCRLGRALDPLGHYPPTTLTTGLTDHFRLRITPVSYTHLRAHETVLDLVCRLLLEKKKKKITCLLNTFEAADTHIIKAA